MSDQYKFLRPIVCDGRACAADEVVPAGDIPAGTLDTCLRLGHCVPCDPAGLPADLPRDLTTDGSPPDLTTDAPPRKPSPRKRI